MFVKAYNNDDFCMCAVCTTVQHENMMCRLQRIREQNLHQQRVVVIADGGGFISSSKVC